MGSTEKTRSYQNKVSKFQLAETGLINWDEAVQANKDSCQVYGLKFHYDHNISTEGNLHHNLANEIERFHNLGYEQVLLGLRKPSGSGHAVNLIFNATEEIYSIEDDNLGRIDFSSLGELQELAKTYFATFYQDYPQLSFETYALDS